MSLDHDLRAVAAQQYGLVSRRHARALGARTSGLRSRVRHADWQEPTPRVLRLVGTPPGTRQDLMLAVLDAAQPRSCHIERRRRCGDCRASCSPPSR